MSKTEVSGWSFSQFDQVVSTTGRTSRVMPEPTIKLEEVVWGGVGKDGIPDLTNAPVLPATEAGYLAPDDRVFGVSLNSEHRAYPLRILNPHEMANDVLGGVHFALAY